MLALCASLLLLAGSAFAQADTVKRVLLISTGSRLAPGYLLVDQQILAALQRIPATQVQIYGENLDLLLFTEERYQQIFRDYLAEKYLERPPDLVVLVFVGRVEIPGKVLGELFPNTPTILAGFVEEEVTPQQFGGRFGGILQWTDPQASLELMLRLQPNLRRIVVIGGTAEVDRQSMRRVRRATARYADRIKF
jgi:hypothetical protein